MPIFLEGGGECGALIAARDWSGSLGPPESWSPSLKAATGLLLRSPVPMAMLWGEDGVLLYNDAYARIAGDRHPELLGSKVREGWPEAADFNEGVLQAGLAGETRSFKDAQFTLNRNGAPEQVWFDLDYSPVPGDDGTPAGVLAIVIETSERVKAEQALRTKEQRLRGVLDGMGEAMGIMDRDLRIIDQNAAARRLDPRPPEEVIGRLHCEAYPDVAPELTAAYRKALDEQVGVELEHRYEWSDGRAMWLEMRAYPIEEGLAIFWRDISERKQAEQQVRGSEERFRETTRRLDAILNNTEMAIFLMDDRQQCVFANAAAEELTGYSFAQMQGRPLHDVVHHKYPDGRHYPIEECPIDRAFPERARMGGEELFVAPDGSFYPVAFTASPMLDDAGQPVGTVIEARNIAQERARDAAMRESEERFRNIADHTPVMLWVTDETGYCTYLNKSWYEFTGQQPGEGEGFGWLNAVHPDDRPMAERAFLQANEQQADYEVDFRLRRKDGEYRWCIDAAKPRFDSAGRHMGYVGSVIDNDERREAIEKVRASEEMLRSVIEQMPVGIAVAEIPSGKIVQFNQTLEDMLRHPILWEDASTYDRYGGIDEEGKPLPANAYPLARAVLFGETVVGDEMRYRRGDGHVIDLLGHAAPIVGSDGKAKIAVVTLQDITDRKKGEQHQRLLIDELSHRAKNLLAIIQSVAQQSFKNGHSPAAMLASFEGRLGALAAAHGILTQQRWESAPLRQVICDTILAVKPDDDRLRLEGPDVMVAPKTSVSIAMAIHELATNAVKYGSFSNDDGQVSVTWRVESGRLTLEWRERGGPPVQPPGRRGFGSRMIERGLAAELGGQVKIDFDPEGVVCRVDAPFNEAH